MKYPTSLFIVTAVVEAGAGACLLLLPAAAFDLLLGASTPALEATLVGRIAGAALLTLGISSSLARHDKGSSAQRGLLTGLLFYNGAVGALLVYAALGCGLVGVALWPAVVLHTALAGWCGACRRTGP